jgi:hypothetical protein
MKISKMKKGVGEKYYTSKIALLYNLSMTNSNTFKGTINR